MFNDDRLAGTVVFDGKYVYLLPATFDKATNETTEALFNGYGVNPDVIIPAQGGEIPAALQNDFPDDKDAFIYKFDPKPLVMPEPGELGGLDPQKAKDNFRKLHRKKVSLRELAMTFAISRVLVTKDKGRH